jgi:hypothetical protein
MKNPGAFTPQGFLFNQLKELYIPHTRKISVCTIQNFSATPIDGMRRHQGIHWGIENGYSFRVSAK